MLTELGVAQLFLSTVFFPFFFRGGGWGGGGFGGSRITKLAFVLAKKDITSLATRSKKPLYGWAKRIFSNHVIK